jgi:hypothetical protein
MGVASMKKWYFTVALLAAWLGHSATVSAQGGLMPTPYGAARIPEPLPCGPTCPTPDLVPGPIDPSALPPVPCQGTDLPAGHSSAFQCEEFARDDHCFFHLGAEAWLRQKLGSEPIAFMDPSNLKNGIVGANNLGTIQNPNDIAQHWNIGPRLTIGYVSQNQAIEVTGFWIPQATNSTEVDMAGQIDLPFQNPPVGFEGDNGMWLHADRVVTTFKSTMWSGEINYRYNDAAVTCAELILGVRYLDLKESLGIFTGDDDLTFTTPNGPDPTRQATYQTQTHNRIVAPQIGFEWGHPFTPLFTLGVTAKAAVGVDFAEIHNTLIRGDGLVGFDTKHTTTIGPSQIYDAGAFIDFNILERVKLHVGYNAMFLVNVAPAADQVDYNLANPFGRNETHSTIFYHGPVAELQILF